MSLSCSSSHLSFHAATLRVAGSLQQSTEVMKTMQQLVKLPDISKTMQDMSREMMKAGIIEEMLEDTMESMEPEELEEEAQEEIDKVRREGHSPYGLLYIRNLVSIGLSRKLFLFSFGKIQL